MQYFLYEYIYRLLNSDRTQNFRSLSPKIREIACYNFKLLSTPRFRKLCCLSLQGYSQSWISNTNSKHTNRSLYPITLMMIYYHVLMILCWASQYRGALTSLEVLCILHIMHKNSYYGSWARICYPITSSYWVTWHIISNKSSLDRSMLPRGILAIISSL